MWITIGRRLHRHPGQSNHRDMRKLGWPKVQSRGRADPAASSKLQECSRQGPFDVIMKLVSLASGIPLRILTGSERGELASSQDDGNWAGRIEERQLHYAEPVILRPLVDRLIFIGALPEPKDGEYRVNWQSLSDPGERERAETAEIVGRAAVNFQTASHILTLEEGREILGLQGPAPVVEDGPVATGGDQPDDNDSSREASV